MSYTLAGIINKKQNGELESIIIYKFNLFIILWFDDYQPM